MNLYIQRFRVSTIAADRSYERVEAIFPVLAALEWRA